MKKIFSLALGILLMTACTSSQLQFSTRVALEAKLADVLLESSEPESVVRMAPLTEAEAIVLDEAISTYREFRAKWKHVNEIAPDQLATNLLMLQSDYQDLRESYQRVYDVVLKHWDEYDAFRQSRLRSYDAQAQQIDLAANELMRNQQAIQTINTVLELGLLVAKVAAV